MNVNLSSLTQLRSSNPKGIAGALKHIVSSRTWTTAIVLTLILIAALAYIWQRVRALDLLAEVQALESVNTDYKDQLRKLDSDVAQLSTAGRIIQLAQEDLKLEPAPLDKLYTVRFQEETPGESGMRAFMGAIKRSVAKLPRVESAEVAAEELFDHQDSK